MFAAPATGADGAGPARQPFEHVAALILRFDGAGDRTVAEAAQARSTCRAHGGFDLGSGRARGWYRDRYHTPHLREVLFGRGVLLDVVETATEWENVTALHGPAQAALTQAITATGSKAIVMCHLSHTYTDGASLYFTFLAHANRGHEPEQ